MSTERIGVFDSSLECSNKNIHRIHAAGEEASASSRNAAFDIGEESSGFDNTDLSFSTPMSCTPFDEEYEDSMESDNRPYPIYSDLKSRTLADQTYEEDSDFDDEFDQCFSSPMRHTPFDEEYEGSLGSDNGPCPIFTDSKNRTLFDQNYEEDLDSDDDSDLFFSCPIENTPFDEEYEEGTAAYDSPLLDTLKPKKKKSSKNGADKDPKTIFTEADTCTISDSNSEVVSQNEITQKDVKTYTCPEMEEFIVHELHIRRIDDHLYFYTGHIYAPLDQLTLSRMLREYLPTNAIQAIQSAANLDGVYKLLCTRPNIDMDTSESAYRICRNMIVFENGIYDAGLQTLIPHSAEYPLFFDVNAFYTEESIPTPYFDQFLHHASGGDKEVEKLMLQTLGYLLINGNPGKCFFMFGTAKNSGKSLFGDFVGSLFRDELVANTPLMDMHGRFSLGSLWKKCVNIAMDLPTRVLKEEEVSKIKLLTGDRKIQTEQKYEAAATTVVRCKCMFGTNAKIVLKVADDAFWDRMVLVPFMHSVDRDAQDKDMLEHLLLERDGITSKAARAVKDLVDNNYVFQLPELSKRMLHEWKTGKIDDSIDKFIRDKCEFNPDYHIFSKDLYEAYKQYCVKHDIYPESQTALSRRLKKLPGVDSFKRRYANSATPIWCFDGVSIDSLKGDAKNVSNA